MSRLPQYDRLDEGSKQVFSDAPEHSSCWHVSEQQSPPSNAQVSTFAQESQEPSPARFRSDWMRWWLAP